MLRSGRGCGLARLAAARARRGGRWASPARRLAFTPPRRPPPDDRPADRWAAGERRSTVPTLPEAEAAAAGATWVDSAAPPWSRPYLRLARADRPIGTWLLLWPCWWSAAMATPAGHAPAAATLALFAAGALVMRGAGCTVNDLWDRDVDRRVARTTRRPLASGELSARQGLAFLAAQLSAGLAVLLCFNGTTVALACLSLPLVAVYPLMKRVTNWPQAVLGLTFNWGALVGWTAVAGHACWPAMLPLYGAGVCWTVFYDTIYAHQDKDDDLALGLGSTALRFGDRTKAWLAGFGAGTVSLLYAAGAAAGLSVADAGAAFGYSPFFWVSVAGGGAHLAWQAATVRLNDGPDCMRKFVSNRTFGGLVAAGIVLDKLLVC